MQDLPQKPRVRRLLRFAVVDVGRPSRWLRLPALRGGRTHEIRAITSHPSAADPSFAALLASGEIDALYLGARACSAEWLLAALRSGLHVVCSAAPLLSTDGWRRMEELGHRTGAELMVASPIRCAPLHRAAAELVRVLSVGHPVSLAVRACGGAPLESLLRTGFALGRRILGSEPVEVMAASSPDTACVLRVTLRLATEQVLAIVCGDGAPAGVFYEVGGTRTTLRVSAPAAEATGTVTFAGSSGTLPARTRLVAALEQLSVSLTTNQEIAAAREAVRDAELLEAVRQALRSDPGRGTPPSAEAFDCGVGAPDASRA